jgi:CheY-like chemotaxis protein
VIGADEFRILVVDDTASIHRDYQHILAPPRADPGERFEEQLFGRKRPAARAKSPRFYVGSAYQGRHALDMVEESLRAGAPYALAFVDVRMPPGWDGIETVCRIWAVHPDLEVVIATAYSDRSLDDIVDKLGRRDRFLVLKKPFDSIVVLQMACSLTEKWQLRQSLWSKVQSVTTALDERASRLDAIENAGDSPGTAELREQLRAARKSLQEATAKMRELTETIGSRSR